MNPEGLEQNVAAVTNGGCNMFKKAGLEQGRAPVAVFTFCPLCGSHDYKLDFEHREIGSVVRCRQCGLKYTHSRWTVPWWRMRQQDPGPLPDVILQKQDSQTDDFLDVLRRIKRYQPNGKLLELGCLTGHFLALAKKAGYEPVGIEPDPWAAQYARDQSDVQVHETLIPKLHFEDRTFDVIAMFHVMEHLTEPMETLLDLRRILKETGLLAIEVPIIDTLFPIVLGARHRHYIFDHTLFMKRGNALEFLKKAGFKVLRTELTGRHLRLERLAWALGKSNKSLSRFLDGAFKALHVQEQTVHVNLRDNYRIYCQRAD